MESLAQSYFERFTGGGDNAKALAEIEKLIDPQTPANGEQENEWLDFKQFIQTDDELKRRLSRSIGAMANVGGGVIIWGIQTDWLSRQPTVKKRDTAVNKLPIANVDAFRDRLVHWYKFLTDPPLSRVRFEVIYDDEAETSGYVVQFIPEGDAKPYFSLEDQKYYHRVWDESEVIQQPMLRSLFFPRARVSVKMTIKPIYEYSITTILQGRGQCTKIWEISLLNDGETSLEQAELLFSPHPNSSLTIVRIHREPSRYSLSPLDEDAVPLRQSFHPRMNWAATVGMACEMSPEMVRFDLFAGNSCLPSLLIKHPYALEKELTIWLRSTDAKEDTVLNFAQP